MIKYINNYKYHNVLYNTNSQIDIKINLMYKYVDFYNEIYLGYR